MSDNRPVPWPWSMKRSPAALSEIPVSIKELFGKSCRVVRFDEKTPQDIVPGRVTIILDVDSRICEIYIEPLDTAEK